VIIVLEKAYFAHLVILKPWKWARKSP